MFTKLLVPLDGSALAEQALGPAAMIARASRANLELLLAHPPWAFVEFVDEELQANPTNSERAYIAATAQELAKGASITVSGTAEPGFATDRICARVNAVNADLIVMTSHGRTGLSRSWFGSVAHDVIRRSRVPVLILRPVGSARGRPRRERLFKKVLVTLDGSALSEAILQPASDLTRAFDARLVLLRVVEPVPLVVPEVVLPMRNLPRDDAATADVAEQATANLAAIVRRLAESGVGRVESHVVVAARVAKAILAFARGMSASVIAMSTHGRGASRLFLGSVTDKVLRGSSTPMLLRRPEEVREEPALIDDTRVASQLAALSGHATDKGEVPGPDES